MLIIVSFVIGTVALTLVFATLRRADRFREDIADLAAIVPAILGIILFLDQIETTRLQNRNFRALNEQASRLIEQRNLSRDLSIRFWVISHGMRELNFICNQAANSGEFRNHVLNFAERLPRLRAVRTCGVLDNIADSAVAWAATPEQAARFRDHEEMQRLIAALEPSSPFYELQRRGAITPAIEIEPEEIKARLARLHDLILADEESGRLEQIPETHFAWVWLLALAAALEVAKIASRGRVFVSHAKHS